MMWRLSQRLAATLLFVAGPPSAHAQVYSDPTRPPAELLAPRAGATQAVPAPLPSSGPQLQSVLVSTRPGGRRIAVIDGQTVRVGGLVNGARVTAIGAKEVTLRRGAESHVLKLFPIQNTAQGSTRAPGAPAELQPSGAARPLVPLSTPAPASVASGAAATSAASVARQ